MNEERFMHGHIGENRIFVISLMIVLLSFLLISLDFQFIPDETLMIPVLSSSIALLANRPPFSCLNVAQVERLLNRKMVSFEEGLKIMRKQEAILV
jgi:hypothetical protein